jgi:hypothetical protein
MHHVILRVNRDGVMPTRRDGYNNTTQRTNSKKKKDLHLEAGAPPMLVGLNNRVSFSSGVLTARYSTFEYRFTGRPLV